MLKLTKIAVNKYKCFESEQAIDIEPNITVIVGKNEAGKTALLEAIGKTAYFEEDAIWKFNTTLDYPRKWKKAYDRSEEVAPVITCEYGLTQELRKEINAKLGSGVLKGSCIAVTTDYDNKKYFTGVEANIHKFLVNHLGNTEIDPEFRTKYMSITCHEDINVLLSEENAKGTEQDNTIIELLKKLLPYFAKSSFCENALLSYIIEHWIIPTLPKFLYYDEYYSLPHRINLDDLNDGLEPEEAKTAKALLDLADIDLAQVRKTGDFESVISELEATGSDISRELFKYWSTNKDLRVRFQIDKQAQHPHQMRSILDVRIWSEKHEISLPLKNRSKGFKWFFSFLVWFSKIQEDKNNNYIILLDEPGLNLHASAQADLMNFLDDLGDRYQIIYTTHSPFMVDSKHLHRVRTVNDTEKSGTVLSDSIKEKDPDTLFPLQAALGYDIAQNLFISPKNLLVEGPADLVYLTTMSSLLDSVGRSHLDGDITIIPVGGLDKVATFISLLRGNKLKVACLLDSFTNVKGKQKVENLVKMAIIQQKRIRFFDEFSPNGGTTADIEDMFKRSDYIKIYNMAFPDKPLSTNFVDNHQERIVKAIECTRGESFCHYSPANILARQGTQIDFFEKETLDAFEHMFGVINKLF